jgi:hypothetical protein
MCRTGGSFINARRTRTTLAPRLQFLERLSTNNPAHQNVTGPTSAIVQVGQPVTIGQADTLYVDRSVLQEAGLLATDCAAL